MDRLPNTIGARYHGHQRKSLDFGFDGRRREEMRGEITRDEETRDEREDTKRQEARGQEDTTTSFKVEHK